MRSIDKNDIDIKKLFTWGAKFEILDNNDRFLLDVYIRLVGDAELNRAKVFALRKSAELRSKLKQKGSDERIAFIPDLHVLEKESMVESALLYMVRDVTNDSIREVRLPLPVEPASDASLEKQEAYQKEVDDFPGKIETLRIQYITNILEQRRQELLSKDIESLYKEFERSIINQLCEDEMILKFREMCAYFGSFSDSDFKIKLFESFEEFENLPKEIKDQFLDCYNSLEISGEDLKKSLEVMQ